MSCDPDRAGSPLGKTEARKRDCALQPIRAGSRCLGSSHGCSFANGSHFLKNNQTVSHKLAKLTNRNVYNFAMCGCGLQQMLYIIQNCLTSYLPSNENPEYAIYFYIPNHIERLRVNIFPNLFFNGTVLHYKLKNTTIELEKKSNSFLYRTFIIKSLYSSLDKKRKLDIEQDKIDNFELANKILLKTREELKKLYPDIKFIIVKYEIENDDTHREVSHMWDSLEKQGFTIINSEDLIGRKFKYNSEDTTIDKYHPSEMAWDILVPKLIKKLNL